MGDGVIGAQTPWLRLVPIGLLAVLIAGCGGRPTFDETLPALSPYDGLWEGEFEKTVGFGECIPFGFVTMSIYWEDIQGQLRGSAWAWRFREMTIEADGSFTGLFVPPSGANAANFEGTIDGDQAAGTYESGTPACTGTFELERTVGSRQPVADASGV